MDYPIELLPNPDYKSIDCNLSDKFLVRFVFSNVQEEIWDNEIGQIKAKHIYSPDERIDDLSMSLWGVFSLNHVYIDFTQEGKSKYMHYCNPNTEVEAPLFKTHFIKNENKHYWSIPINTLDKLPFDYTRSNTPFVAICKVLHTPMLWNFWHFSLRWDLGDLGQLEDLDYKERIKIARRIGHSVKAHIAKFAKIDTLPEIEIKKECYSVQ